MEKYDQLVETLQKIKRAEERLKVLIENKSVLESKVREKKEILEKENYDVEKLEGLSISGIIHLLKGTLIDKFDQEEREAMIAKNQYEFACEELNVCIREIERARERVKDKYLIEREYEKCLKEQEEKLIGENQELAQAIKRLTERDFYHSEVVREIDEAIAAGKQLSILFACILKSFVDADSLGIIDMLEGGLLVADSANQAVKDTNAKLVLMQQEIKKYHLELLDVLDVTDMKLDLTDLICFSDAFLAGVMRQSSLADKIGFAQSKLREMIEDIRSSLNRLEQKRISLENKRQLIKTEKIRYIETALEIQ